MKNTPESKRQLNIRLSLRDERLLNILVEEQGLSKTAIVKIALREWAKRNGIDPRKPERLPHEDG